MHLPPMRTQMSHHIMLLLCAAATAACASPISRPKSPPAKPIRALLVLGGCCHDYPAQQEILTKGISARANVVWTVAYDPDTGTSHKNPIYDNPDWAKGF